MDTPFHGWSMTKSVFNALVGILVKQGKLALDDYAPVPEWQLPNDPRKGITLNHLLHMSSGMEFGEHYKKTFSDVILMLFREKNTAAFAARKPIISKPGTTWHYSSGTTNIISRIIRHAIGQDSYLVFRLRSIKIGYQDFLQIYSRLADMTGNM
jgi:CubicO group peptidase (beta-lactamase class C family)